MYHNNNAKVVEAHDDVKTVEKATIEHREGKPTRLHVTYVLKDGEYGEVEHLHSTNGVNHTYDAVEHSYEDAKRAKK